MSAIRTVQTAFYTRLAGDATLAGLSMSYGSSGSLTTVTVHNQIPEGQAYPQVLISRATETPWHRFGGPMTGLGWKAIIRTHVYSRYKGDSEALRIHERVLTLLNFQPLLVSDFASAIVELEQTRVLVEDIEKIETRHLVGEWCIWVQQ